MAVGLKNDLEPLALIFEYCSPKSGKELFATPASTFGTGVREQNPQTWIVAIALTCISHYSNLSTQRISLNRANYPDTSFAKESRRIPESQKRLLSMPLYGLRGPISRLMKHDFSTIISTRVPHQYHVSWLLAQPPCHYIWS